MKLFSYAMMLGACFIGSTPSFAAGSIASGKALAEERCATCHVVGRDAPKDFQPTGQDFIEIKHLDDAQLNKRLKTLHSALSKFPPLTEVQISDLVAYIASMAH